MDPVQGSASIRNQIKLNGGDCENNRSCKSSPHSVSGGSGENVLSATSNPTDGGSGPSCISRIRQVSSLTNDAGQSSRHRDNHTECNKNCSASQTQTSGLNSHGDHLPESSSKSDSYSYDNGLDSSLGPELCQRHQTASNNSLPINTEPSTSGVAKPKEVVKESNVFKENRKRPSSLKLNRPNLDDDYSSSDTGNDDYSLGSEDGCIYTYRGGEHLADLPSSFFSLDMGISLDKHLPILPNYVGPQPAVPAGREQGSRASSPDMDFIEMDFDPGPSCEADTGDESTPEEDLEEVDNILEEIEPVPRGTSPEYLPGPIHPPPPVESSSKPVDALAVPSTSKENIPKTDVPEATKTSPTCGPFITHTNVRGEQLLVRRTMNHWPATVPVTLHVSSGDLVSPRDVLNYEEELAESPHAHQINQGERPAFDSANLSSTLYHLTMAKRLMAEKARSDVEGQDNANMSGESGSGASGSSGPVCTEPPRCMVWSEREACERSVTQLATSACGATAVVNVFIALGVPVNIERINSAIGTRLRANNAPIPRYLLSRAVAGCTAEDLVTCLQQASDGLVTARFFPTYPERAVSLSHWLADWISIGSVPILTLNLQVGCDGEIPDAWHHQMVFGVSPRGVYLCNPVECVRETALWPRLTSPSVLLVRTRDVLARFSPHTDLTPLMHVPDERFITYNVLGQVVNVIREWRASGWAEAGTRTRHVRLPAAYRAGVTVAALTGSEAHRRLMHAPHLCHVRHACSPRLFCITCALRKRHTED